MSRQEREDRAIRALEADGWVPDDPENPRGRWHREPDKDGAGIMFPKGETFRHIDRIVWKPINWHPESPDQYADGLPPSFKPESKYIIHPNGDVWYVEGGPLEPTMLVYINWCPVIWEQEETVDAGLMGALSECTWMGQLRRSALTVEDTEGESFTVFAPSGALQVVLELPADKDGIMGIIDALLYVQRRTHEHDWEGPDDGLEELEG